MLAKSLPVKVGALKKALRPSIKPWGFCLHTTGKTIVERARKAGRDPLDLAIEFYRGDFKSHYLIHWDGSIYQFMPDTVRGAHIGVTAYERELYLSGVWRNDWKDSLVYDIWTTKWNVPSPQSLYPGKSPNAVYVGIEMLPLENPTEEGLWFSDAQHHAVISLLKERSVANKISLATKTGRLLGHEDVDAYGRWQKSGGWDPGGLRMLPRFDWARVYGAL